jgi:hypothetical protein
MAKKKTSRKTSSKKANREVLVVASKVKAYVKGKDMNTSADAINALSARIYEMLDSATDRTTSNGRKTLKAYDL